MFVKTIKPVIRTVFIRLALLSGVLALIAWAFLAYSNWLVINTASPGMYATVDSVPYSEVGVVPGTKPGGFYFANRIETAAALYHAGKIKWLIVSGDNRHHNYNEPHEMQRALIAKGVPVAAIYCDYAGFTTLDTVIRAREIFGQHKITVVSQAFQNQRALFLASKNEIEAVGVNAADVPVQHRYWLGALREYVARGRAVIDTSLLQRQPHFGGQKIIPGKSTGERCAASQ